MQRLKGTRRAAKRPGIQQRPAVDDTRDDLQPIKVAGTNNRAKALWLLVGGLLFAAVALATLTFFHGSKPTPAPPKRSPSPSPPSRLPSHLPTAKPSASPGSPSKPPGKHASPPPAPAPAPQPYQPKHAADTVTVVQGDNLWKLAVLHYGNGEDWHKIYNANRAEIGPNPNIIQPGWQLVEP